MSKLALVSFVGYRPLKSQGYEFHPKPREIIPGAERPTIVLGDVPLPPRVPHPEIGLTTLYGFRDALEELQKQYAIAISKGMSIIKVECKVDVGEILMGTATHTSLPRTQFLNLMRLAEPLQTLILDGIDELARAEGKKMTDFSKIGDAGKRPDLLCRVIRSEPLFRHIKTVVYTVPDGSVKGRKVATVLTDEIEEVEFRGDMPFDIVLPKIPRTESSKKTEAVRKAA